MKHHFDSRSDPDYPQLFFESDIFLEKGGISMVESYLQFSTLLDVGSKENVPKALKIYESYCIELEEKDEWVGFEVEADNEADTNTKLWLYSEDFGDDEHVIPFVRKLGKELQLKGKWGFTYSVWCSKMLLDAFSGGAHVIDLETGHCDSIHAAVWLDEQLTKAA